MKKVGMILIILLTVGFFAQAEDEDMQRAMTEARGGVESRYGFYLSVGSPALLSYGLDFQHSSHMFSASLEYGGWNFKVGDVEAGLKHYDVTGRWHPFVSSFFVGLKAGQQMLSLSANQAISGQNVNVDLELTSPYLTPHFGWLSFYESGFTWGFEMGYQIPSGVKADVTTDADSTIQATTEYSDFKKDVEDKAKPLGKIAIPTVAFLRFGWVF